MKITIEITDEEAEQILNFEDIARMKGLVYVRIRKELWDE